MMCRRHGQPSRGLLAPLLVLARLRSSGASPFDPHPIPALDPFVEGWFARVVDHSSNLSVAVIVAAYSPGGSSGGFNAPGGEAWAALLLQRRGKPPITRQLLIRGRAGRVAVTKHGAPVVDPPTRGAPACFEYASAQGHLNVSGSDGGDTHFNFEDAETEVRIELHLSMRVPYSRTRPDIDGPEGWLPDPLLPTHYWVQSLASEAVYTVKSPGEPSLHGTGLAHLEANWGSTFPAGWVWAQAIKDARTQFVLTGGNFTIAGTNSAQWIVSVRAPALPGGALDFRTIDADLIRADEQPNAASLRLNASSALGHRLHLLVVAPEHSFSAPLLVPSRSGFHGGAAGSVESYVATATLVVEAAGRQILTETIELAALEFGGTARVDVGT